LVRKGNRSAKLVARLLGQVDKLLGSILLGNTLVNVAAAAVANIIILRLFGQNDLAILLGTLTLTFVIVVFSEIMPRSSRPVIQNASHCQPATCSHR